jgi:two-component system LytT family sensor kinase
VCCTNEVGSKHKDATGGIGIDNVRKRLALLYPNNHSLDIEQQHNTFKVKLKLGNYEIS